MMFPMTGMADGPGGKPGGRRCLTSWRTSRRTRSSAARQPATSTACPQESGAADGELIDTMSSRAAPLRAQPDQTMLTARLLGAAGAQRLSSCTFSAPASKAKIGQKLKANPGLTSLYGRSIVPGGQFFFLSLVFFFFFGGEVGPVGRFFLCVGEVRPVRRVSFFYVCLHCNCTTDCRTVEQSVVADPPPLPLSENSNPRAGRALSNGKVW